VNRLRVLVPDLEVTRAADWSPIPGDVVFYDPTCTNPPSDGGAQVLVAGPGPQAAVQALARGLPQLEVLQTLYAGVERWDELLPPQVRIVNASGAFGASTAEIATMGLVALLRGLPDLLRAQTDGVWRPVSGETLAGKSVVVLGAGDVGRHVRRQFEGFGAEVTLAAREARDDVRSLCAVRSEIGRFDVVVIALPLTPRTRRLVDREFLADLRDRAVLVNVGRGPIVDTDALVAELVSGRLRAVLDVTDPEPLPAGHRLWGVDGLVLTPHVGGMVPGGVEAAIDVAIDQIRQYAAGLEPSNSVERAATG